MLLNKPNHKAYKKYFHFFNDQYKIDKKLRNGSFAFTFLFLIIIISGGQLNAQDDPLSISGDGTVDIAKALDVLGMATLQKLNVKEGATINNAFVGDVGHGQTWAGFSHNGNVDPKSYALLQKESGMTTLINKKAGDGFIGFRIDNIDKMVILNNGNVGIGTTAPNYKMVINGNFSAGYNSNTTSFLGRAAIGYGGGYNDYAYFGHLDVASSSGNYALLQSSKGTTFLNASTGKNINFRINNQTKMIMNAKGFVGIGQNNPTKARLQIAEGGNGIPSTEFAFYRLQNGKNDARVMSFSGQPVCIWAEGMSAASGFYAFSDARIKNIIGVTNSQSDLQILGEIEICDYTYRDIVKKGTKVNKKVVAQQLAEVYPQAVKNDMTEVVPDIFLSAEIIDGWIGLKTNLKVGERVKIISEKGNDLCEVLEAEPLRFRVKFSTEDFAHESVFVYGREVNDFHMVDYDAISMLNVSATQELAEQVKQLRTENKTQAELISDLKKQIDAQAKQNEILLSLKASVDRLELLQYNETASIPNIKK